MRRRIIGFAAALVLAVLGAAPVAHAVTGPECVKQTAEGKGKVEYDSATALWTCIGGAHDGEPITTK
ncbi:hypothetical protein [Streptomyces sp. NPDC059072]|uniref:hypothetical protein n=1 Tax=unclassified Streptomyces TaxID=2593676 RepID=UPI0036A2CD62